MTTTIMMMVMMMMMMMVAKNQRFNYNAKINSIFLRPQILLKACLSQSHFRWFHVIVLRILTAHNFTHKRTQRVISARA